MNHLKMAQAPKQHKKGQELELERADEILKNVLKENGMKEKSLYEVLERLDRKR